MGQEGHSHTSAAAPCLSGINCRFKHCCPRFHGHVPDNCECDDSFCLLVRPQLRTRCIVHKRRVAVWLARNACRRVNGRRMTAYSPLTPPRPKSGASSSKRRLCQSHFGGRLRDVLALPLWCSFAIVHACVYGCPCARGPWGWGSGELGGEEREG